MSGTNKRRVLQLGDTGPEVITLQHRLQQLNRYISAADGIYDDGVRDAVAGYQADMGITTDPAGVYGPATSAALEGAS